MQLALLHFELGHIERRSETFGVCLIFVFHFFSFEFCFDDKGLKCERIVKYNLMD